jgi:hypothetical protein
MSPALRAGDACTRNGVRAVHDASRGNAFVDVAVLIARIIAGSETRRIAGLETRPPFRMRRLIAPTYGGSPDPQVDGLSSPAMRACATVFVRRGNAFIA